MKIFKNKNYSGIFHLAYNKCKCGRIHKNPDEAYNIFTKEKFKLTENGKYKLKDFYVISEK